MNIDYLYWFFSTIAQTLGAIVAVVGMLSIYRLQVIYGRIKDLVKDNKERFTVVTDLRITPPHDPVEFAESCITICKAIDSKSDAVSSDTVSHDLHKAADEILDIVKHRKKIIQQFTPFLIIHLGIIFASIIALPLCKLFESSAELLPFPLKIFMVIFVISFTIGALVKAFQQTKELCILMLIE